MHVLRRPKAVLVPLHRTLQQRLDLPVVIMMDAYGTGLLLDASDAANGARVLHCPKR